MIERGNLWPKRLLVNVCKKNLVLQIERGNPWCVKTIASCMLTMEQGNLWNRDQAHTVEEFGSAEHRGTASSNANKFNLATDEVNFDFNISGVPNAMVKRSHGVNVQNLIQKIENHPQRQALQSDLQQHRPFNPFSKESQDVIKAAGELVVNTLFQEVTNHHNEKDGFRETQELDPYWKSRPVICTENMELKSESGLWVKIILNLGSEFLMDQINSWLIQTTTTQKFLQVYLKNKRHNWLWRILQPDQRQKQNHKEENLLIYRASFRWTKESGLILNQENLLSLRTKSRRK